MIETRTLDVPGATLTYDVRPGGAPGEPPLLLIGSPMGAAGFGTLVRHFGDRTVVTYDPRGIERSTKADPSELPTPDEHAGDLHRLIQHVGGPVDLFASSGGAVNALALVAKHPADVRTLVAHEPPLIRVLPDREEAEAASRAVHATYMRSGTNAGMAHFLALITHQGPFPSDWAERPAPDPAMFGMPAEDDGSRNDPLLSHTPDSGPQYYEPDFDAIRAAPTRVVLAAGVESEGILMYRATLEAARRLGRPAVIFPSHHGGFLGGEYGQTGKPAELAAKLREVLDAR